jgi:hypothetical protein
MNALTKQALGFVGAFLALSLVVGAGTRLSLLTLNSEFATVSILVLGLVAASIALVSAIAILSRPSVSNPYWSPK